MSTSWKSWLSTEVTNSDLSKRIRGRLSGLRSVRLLVLEVCLTGGDLFYRRGGFAWCVVGFAGDFFRRRLMGAEMTGKCYSLRSMSGV